MAIARHARDHHPAPMPTPTRANGRRTSRSRAGGRRQDPLPRRAERPRRRHDHRRARRPRRARAGDRRRAREAARSPASTFTSGRASGAASSRRRSTCTSTSASRRARTRASARCSTRPRSPRACEGARSKRFAASPPQRPRCIGRRSTTCTSTRSARSTPSSTSSAARRRSTIWTPRSSCRRCRWGAGSRRRARRLPLPAPATVECLAGFATYDAGIDFELVTPTGAAIVGAHATGSRGGRR